MLDAVYYVLFQFAGGVLGVAVAALVLGHNIAVPAVNYAVTVPGKYGAAAAFFAEFVMAAILMAVVLWLSNRPDFRAYTGYCVGILIAFYILLFAPISGFSINPARTVGSAVFAQTWTSVWIYFIAPPLGMITSAEAYVRLFGRHRVLCAELHQDPNFPYPFSATTQATSTMVRAAPLRSYRYEMPHEYDAIVIGTGAGGGTLALHLAQAGKKILILERGPFMPQEKLNWDTDAVFIDNRYHTKETWQDKEGKDLHPQQAYFVGGQTKVYGAAMFRMRAEDFGVIQHEGGVSPAWPITYADMELYYTKAEDLFEVRGSLGKAPAVPGGFGSSFDPTEPFHSQQYPYHALPNEPQMQAIEDSVRKLGVNTFPMPLGIKRDETNPLASKCIRCDTCDAYPCLIHAKSDADVNCIRRIMHLPNVTLMTNSRVTRLITNLEGTAVTSVEVIHSGDDLVSKGGKTATYSAGYFALCAGAVNSAVVLLGSANDKHPTGLANRSDQVGRNFMYHQADALLAITTHRSEDSYTKTWGTNDFYLKDTDPDYPYPLGQVQPIGSFHHEMMKSQAPFFTPGFVLESLKHYAMPWWLTTEDLPDPENRVTIHNTTPLSIDSLQPGVSGPHPSGDTGHTNETARVTDAAPKRIQLSYTPNNVKSFGRLKNRWVDVLKRAGHASTSMPLDAYFKKRIPIEGVGHQNGTCRMGTDPATSVLDVHCKAHDLDNLYVVDASFFVSASAVNPSLTIIANAIRISEHLLAERLK